MVTTPNIGAALSAVLYDNSLVCRPLTWPTSEWDKNAIVFDRSQCTFVVIGLEHKEWPTKSAELLGIWEVLKFDEFTKKVLS